jgi:hypothetical protein
MGRPPLSASRALLRAQRAKKLGALPAHISPRMALRATEGETLCFGPVLR